MEVYLIWAGVMIVLLALLVLTSRPSKQRRDARRRNPRS